MDTEQMSGWKLTLEREIDEIGGRLKALNLELDRKRQQLELVTRLIASENGRSSERFLSDGATTAKTPAPANPSPTEVKDHVFKILTEANRPMNIKEIHAAFVRRGLPIPGKGTHFNILVHISREVRKGNASRFYRTGKGTYAVRLKTRAHQ